jgi:leucyl/phenylalanyl-tRNA--protein transferase
MACTSPRLARTVRTEPFEVRIDTAFDAVVEACAAARPGRPETWINTPIQRLYGQLFARGLAHSVECWDGEDLVGGLYGVAFGGAASSARACSRPAATPARWRWSIWRAG